MNRSLYVREKKMKGKRLEAGVEKFDGSLINSIVQDIKEVDRSVQALLFFHIQCII
jgi:hypothetical protein